MKYLESKKGVASGELVIKGTRIRIAQIIAMLANDYTIDKIHEEWFPHLSTRVLKGSLEEAAEHFSSKLHA